MLYFPFFKNFIYLPQHKATYVLLHPPGPVDEQTVAKQAPLGQQNPEPHTPP